MQFLDISPVSHPISGRVRPPGSKSITNRAMVLAALSSGSTKLTGVLDSQDTRVMVESLRRLGFRVDQSLSSRECTVEGLSGRIASREADLWLENSGTSIRFLTALCALGAGRYRLDGVDRMRQRPIGDLVSALKQLGASISFEIPGTLCPPVVTDGSRGRFVGGSASVHGGISSQFLSAILMAAPAAEKTTTLSVDGVLVSQPYVTMTLQMMKA
ncbi:MAG: 3-phosphoshikimate 1-carboxyvinyltransferase, partial [Phycisphaerae bacterium]